MATHRPTPRMTAVVLMLMVVWGAAVHAVVTPGGKILNLHDPVKYKDCSHLLKAGYNVSGTHVLWMNASASFFIDCEFVDGQAYNVIQRRVDNVVDFRQTYNVYTVGFGQTQGSYWAGLNSINYLTYTGNTKLVIYMQDWSGHNQNVMYSYFRVDGSQYRYQMHVSGFSGSIPDDLSYHNGMVFATYDYPDTYSCAVHMGAGWWYNYCAYTLLNGRYYYGGKYVPSTGFYDGIFWKSWQGFDYSLKFVSMQLTSG